MTSQQLCPRCQPLEARLARAHQSIGALYQEARALAEALGAARAEVERLRGEIYARESEAKSEAQETRAE